MIISYISPKDAKTVADEELPSIRVVNKGITSEEKLPREVERLTPYLLENLRFNPQPAIILQEVLPTLKRLLEKYPTLPILYTYISFAFDQIGEYEKAEKIIEKQYRTTPRYPLGLLNYCFFLLDKNRFTEIPEVLGHKFTLQEVFPEKKEFHLAEVVSFMAVMALYQDSLGHLAAAKEWLNAASKIDPNNEQLQEVAARFKRNALRFNDIQRKHEHFPPSMNFILATPEQDLIDYLTPFLPIPCTILPHIAEKLNKEQGEAISSKTQRLINFLLDGGNEGGVLCEIQMPQRNQKNALLMSITHLAIKPKHKTEIRVQAYQRKRIAQIKKEGGVTEARRYAPGDPW